MQNSALRAFETWKNCLLPLVLRICLSLSNARGTVRIVAGSGESDAWLIDLLMELVCVWTSGIDIRGGVGVVIRLNVGSEEGSGVQIGFAYSRRVGG